MNYALNYIDESSDFSISMPGDVRSSLPEKGELVSFDGNRFKVVNREFNYKTSGKFSKLDSVTVYIDLK